MRIYDLAMRCVLDGDRASKALLPSAAPEITCLTCSLLRQTGKAACRFALRPCAR